MRYFQTESGHCPPFAAGHTAYDPAIAWWLAHCAALSYETKRRTARELEDAGFSRVAFFDNAGTEGFLAWHPGTGEPRTGRFGPFAVLTFRGTEQNFTDILTDIKFLKRKLTVGNVHVHGGFHRALSLVWGSSTLMESRGRRIEMELYGSPGVSDALERLRRETFPCGGEIPVYFTGHSLGGALATLAAAKFSPTALYTFGSPRVGGKNFTRFLGECHVPAYRVVNSTDIVAHVPIPPAFRHYGQVMYFTRRGRRPIPKARSCRRFLELLREILWTPLLLLPNTLLRAFRPKMFLNHRMTEYARKLEASLGHCIAAPTGAFESRRKAA